VRICVAVIGVAISATLTACASVVSMRPAPQATAVACASVVARLQGTNIGSLGYRPTDAQGTLAWGTPADVTLTCGTTNSPPSSECVSFDNVDWAKSSTKQYVRYDTYGRQPTVTVLMTGQSVDPVTVLTTISDPVLAAIPKAANRCGG
jgi:hypothetical protein